MIRINLLKPEKKEWKETAPGLPVQEATKEKAKTPSGNLIILLAVVGIAALFYLQKRSLDREEALLNQAKQEKNKLQYVIAKLAEIETQKATLEKKIDLITQLQAQQEVVVRIMDEVSKALPEWVWLTETAFDKGVVTLKGKALSNNLIGDYMIALENSPYLARVDIKSSTQKTVKNSQFHEFLLTAAVSAKPETAAPPGPLPAETPVPASVAKPAVKGGQK
ncbi:MAG: PilN domain-containing protein [Candidatus Aminicenantes bacterium]|nr:PilN domain-containing protein [Candidatus Aminicenantes bacterium]